MKVELYYEGKTLISGEQIEKLLSSAVFILKNITSCVDEYSENDFAEEGENATFFDDGINSNDEYSYSNKEMDEDSYQNSILESIINMVLRKSKDENLQEKADTNFATDLIASMGAIAGIVKSFFDGSIDGYQLVGKLGDQVWGQIKSSICENGEINLTNGIDIKAVTKGVGYTLAFAGAVSVYEMTSNAIKECQMARENRLKVETECQEVVNMIIQYRQEMNNIVEEYMSDHYSTFMSGFNAMDKYIIDNDYEGYIAQNVRLQEYLGKEVQFRNQDEFDTLMNSEVSLVL